MTRLLLILWLLLGVVFSVTSLAAERIYAYARPLAYQEPRKALPWFELAGKLAPEIHYLRNSAAYLASIDMTVPDDDAIRLLEQQVKYDPYDSMSLMVLAMRYKHVREPEKAKEWRDRINAIWPSSPPVIMLEKLGVD